MLRKTLSELRRVSRTKRTVTLVSMLLVLLGTMTVAVVLAADPDVDGDVEGDSAWQTSDIVRTDPEEGLIPDEYDIKDVYFKTSDDNLTLFCGLDFYSDTVVMNQGGYISVGFDTDVISSTGASVNSGACPNIGAEYRVRYRYKDFFPPPYYWYAINQKCDAGGTCVPHSWADATHATEWEMMVHYAALGLTETQCVSVGIHFENAAVEYDDSVCDMTWCYTDGVTVVDLSSFAASSDGSDSRVIQPGMWALLGLGLALVAAGGLVLWRGWGLAS